MECFVEQSAIDGFDGAIFDAYFAEGTFDDVDRAEAGHFGGNEGGGELAGMDAPVAMSEVFEKEFIEGVAVEHDEGFFGVFWGPWDEGTADLGSEKA